MYELPTSKLNTSLLCLVFIANSGALYVAAHAETWVLCLAAVVFFSFSANTTFSLMHEAVHGFFCRSRICNQMAGCLAAVWFPTSFTVQSAFHMTHHRHNRDEFEQFDLLHNEDIVWLKYAQWYSIMTGLYWFITILGLLIYSVVPSLLRYGVLLHGRSQLAKQTSAINYLSALDKISSWRGRIEIAFTLSIQIALFNALDLNLKSWLLCYAAFAFNWSSLQYTDHAFSPLDVRNGAWNLRTSSFARWVFLNYHYHLAHHQNPTVPWFFLPRYVKSMTDSPSFYEVWIAAWKGPRRMNDLPKFAKIK